MNKGLLIFVHILCALVLLIVACADPTPGKLAGEWRSKADSSILKITDKKFIIDAPAAEDYFVKNDTIFTSFEGNLPYTKYQIKKLGDHELTLFTPDSTTVEYAR